ncbi:MAG: REP-associated tyrosine transposase [Planctomycetota bacterium]|jgi:putative transposase
MSNYLRYYVPGGTYFFTVNTYRRYPFFRNETAIELLRNSWLNIQKEQPFTNIASVLLPDHFHCLWSLPTDDDDFSTRIKRIKDGFTNAWLAGGGYELPVSESKRKNGNRGIWQPRFWEHWIRDLRDLENHFDYIHYNPTKHGYCQRPADWPYSTIHKYIKMGHYHEDWGKIIPNNIKNLDFE